MAKALTSRFFASLSLLVFSLYISQILALECYSCMLIPDQNMTDPGCLEDELPKQTTFAKETDTNISVPIKKLLQLYKEYINNSKTIMTKQPSCLTFSNKKQDTNELRVMRFVYSETPKNLDESGCMETDGPNFGKGKMCFCYQDKCNNMTIQLPLTEKDTGTKSNLDSSGTSSLLPSFVLVVLCTLIFTKHT